MPGSLARLGCPLGLWTQPPNNETAGTIRQRGTTVADSKLGLKDRSHITKKVASEYDNEILIHGRWYDITEFAKKHPGGSIIKWYKGKNATEAYAEFHNRSKKADKFLAAIKSRPDQGKSQLSGELDPVLKDFNELRVQLKEEGFFDPSYPHVAFRIAELVAMHMAGFWLLFHGYSVSGIALLGLAQGRCGWFMHEGGHGSLTGNLTYDIPLQVIFYGTGCGMSAAFWRNQHNKHHATPQKVDHDVDLDTLPLVMFNVKCKDGKQKGLLNKTWISKQAYLFAPVTCLLVALGWQLYIHPRHSIRTKRWHEMASYLVRYSVVAYMHFGMGYAASNVTLGFVAYVWVASAYIFCNFAVSHTHLPCIDADEDVNWVRYSSDHTMNVKPGPFKWVDWWMSYLNYQIEHHLFPSMPQFNHPIISPRVKALFEKHNLTYIEESYPSAMVITFQNLNNIGLDVAYG